MIKYKLVDIDNDINRLITLLVQDMCKENKINYKKQEYKLLFSNEKILFKNNDIKFTSGSKKFLSFYGKIYLKENEKIVETIFLNDDVVTLEPKSDSLLIIFGGVDNSTLVDNDKELLHFYVASTDLIRLQDQSLWQPI